MKDPVLSRQDLHDTDVVPHLLPGGASVTLAFIRVDAGQADVHPAEGLSSSIPPPRGLPYVLVMGHQMEVCPLARGIMLPQRNPYPSHYKAVFAFSILLYPQPYRLASRLAFPEGGLWAYHVSHEYQ